MSADYRAVIRVVALTGTVLTLLLVRAMPAQEKQEVPVVNGMVGSCSADFTIMDAGKKPLYDAKIEVVIRYGLGGFRKIDLQVGTNADGKARVTGLPEKTRKPLEFKISHGSLSKKVTVDPTVKCETSLEVILEPR